MTTKITDWIKEVEAKFDIMYNKDRRVGSSDLFIVSFISREGDKVDAHVYDERITVKKTKYKLLFENFFKAYLALSHLNSFILTPYAHHRTHYFVGFLFHTPKKGSVIDLIARFGKLTDDQASAICMRILNTLNLLNENKFVVSHIPLTCILIDVNDVKLDILKLLLPKDSPHGFQITMNNYFLDSLDKEETPILSPELILDRKISYETGVYNFGMLFYTLVEVCSAHRGHFSQTEQRPQRPESVFRRNSKPSSRI